MERKGWQTCNHMARRSGGLPAVWRRSGARTVRVDRPGMGFSARSRGSGNVGLAGELSDIADGNRNATGEAFWADDTLAAKKKRVEAVLLLSRGPLTSRKLSQLAGLADATEARTLVRKLNKEYSDHGRAFRAEDVAGGYQLMTLPAFAPWLRRLGHIPQSIQLTPPALETVAIVAYRQPVMRAEVEAIRGVACGEILRQLMERDLVRISGRSEELGRPYLYSTTKRFLQIFGLPAADALPALEESEIEISEDPDWSQEAVPTDPTFDPQPVSGIPEKESGMSTAIDKLVIESSDVDVAMLEPQSPASAPSDPSPVAVIEDDEDEIYIDDDDDDDEDEDELDDDYDDDWADDDDVEEDDDDDDDEDDYESDDDDEDADWEEVEDDWDDEDDELDEDLEDDEEWDEEDDGDDVDEDDEDEEWD